MIIRVPVLALHSTIPKSHTMCLRPLPKHFLNSVRLVLGPRPWGAVPVPSHSPGDEPSPDIHPKPALAQPQAFPSGPVIGHCYKWMWGLEKFLPFASGSRQ